MSAVLKRGYNVKIGPFSWAVVDGYSAVSEFDYKRFKETACY